jgi:sulfur-carrier protein
MSISVHYFASLKQLTGCAQQELICSEPMTALQIWQRLQPGRELPEHVLVAVNQVYQSRETVLQDGDELAFFPPVSGG